jgi:zeta-carotene desaturase
MTRGAPGTVVVGAGFAGVAAAVDLARRGARVTLLEERRRAGGRAFSWADPESGETIDNGQHLLMGCYTATRELLRILGTEHLVLFQRRLSLKSVERGGRVMSLSCPSLPSPTHLLAGLMALKGLRARDRWALLRAAPFLLRPPGAGLTVEDWLDRLGQTENLRERFWRPVALATLNEETDVAAASLLAAVLKEAFGGSAAATGLGIPGAGLSELYAGPAERYLRERGGDLRSGCTVDRILTEAGRAVAVIVREGDPIPCDSVVLAVPHTAAGGILPREAIEANPRLERLDELGISAIVSVNLWFDREVTGMDLFGLLGSPIQFVFNKCALWSDGPSRGTYLACVASAASNLAAEPNDRIRAVAEEEIRRHLPAAREAKVVRSMVVREKMATFSGRPEVLTLRPRARTAVANFALAGDWTDTGLPGTIEGAVRSGFAAARIIRPA